LPARGPGYPARVAFTPISRGASRPPAPEVVARRLGELTCIVHAGTFIRDTTVADLEHEACGAAGDGFRDFLFDLTRVARYETPALRAVADLWRRLDAIGCTVYVAARNPGVIDCVHRVVPARGAWKLQPTVTDGLRALLARPV
jgi:hypothetical protein